MKPTKLFTALLFATLAPTTFAQTTVIHAGKLVDVDKGEVVADRAITIENGRVVRVEPWSAAAANNAKLVDWSRYTVLPGLMDMHTHVADEGQSADPGAPLKSTPARTVSQAFFAPMKASRAGVLFSGAPGSADWPSSATCVCMSIRPGSTV